MASEQDIKTILETERYNLASIPKLEAFVNQQVDKKTYHVKFFRGRLLDPFGIDASKSQDMFAEYKKVAKNTFKFYVDYLKTRRKNNLTWAERSHIDV